MKPTRRKKDAPVVELAKPSNNLKSEFEKLKSTPLTRTVRLQFRECDDCSCPFTDIERTVANDSKLKDGDKVYGRMEDDDKRIKK